MEEEEEEEEEEEGDATILRVLGMLPFSLSYVERLLLSSQETYPPPSMLWTQLLLNSQKKTKQPSLHGLHALFSFFLFSRLKCCLFLLDTFMQPCALQPNQQGCNAKWKLSWNTVYLRTLAARFCTFGANLHAQSVLINKISASEFSRKIIKSALLVGKGIRKRRSKYCCGRVLRFKASSGKDLKKKN